MTLGQRIGQYRKQAGLSQEALGERLGVSRQAVSKWETDVASPDMENLLALAREFGVSVSELSGTPEEPARKVPSSPAWKLFLTPILCALSGAAVVGSFLLMGEKPPADPPESLPPDTPAEEVVPPPQDIPDTDFLFLFDSSDKKAYLTLGDQEGLFPFGTNLAPTEPVEVLSTDFGGITLRKVDCGAIQITYHHTEEEPVRDFITHLTTISKDVRLPRDIGVGSTKAEVTAAYGDELVYCLKEESGYTLVQHDYYYAYQTPDTFGLSLCIFMRDGLVAGIRLQHMLDEGNQAFIPDHIFRFPLKDGEPDFSLRQEPELEDISDTRKVYIAWNQLVTNNNLSAEERYAYRRDVFGLLPYINWQEFKEYSGTHEDPQVGFWALMDWLAKQEHYSQSEILWLQMGCMAPGLDGAFTDAYCHVLSQALFYDPIAFAKALNTDGIAEETKWTAIRHAAYDADYYPAECKTTADTLQTALDSGEVFYYQSEQGWAKLLKLYLTTPINDRLDLPKSPTALQ